MKRTPVSMILVFLILLSHTETMNLTEAQGDVKFQGQIIKIVYSFDERFWTFWIVVTQVLTPSESRIVIGATWKIYYDRQDFKGYRDWPVSIGDQVEAFGEVMGKDLIQLWQPTYYLRRIGGPTPTTPLPTTSTTTTQTPTPTSSPTPTPTSTTTSTSTSSLGPSPTSSSIPCNQEPGKYAAMADIRARMYDSYVKDYETNWLGARDLVKGILDGLSDEIISAGLETFFPVTDLALEYKGIVDDANSLKEVFDKPYSLGTRTTLYSYDYESFSYYEISSPMTSDRYPTEFANYVGAETRFLERNLWDMYSDHEDRLPIELLYMRWLVEKERDAWNKQDFEMVRATVAEETQFLSEHLAKWVPTFRRYTGNDPPVVDRDFPSIQNDPYYSLILRIDKFIQDDMNWLTKLEPCILTSSPEQTSTVATWWDSLIQWLESLWNSLIGSH